ncbi:hypothetical protein Tco_0143496, partial [Tanacetum coccineum]
MLDYGYNFMNTKIFIDNESTICIVKNPVFHLKTKHIEIRHHFIRDSNEKKLIQMIKIHTDQNVADLLTKVFDVGIFQYLIANYAQMMLEMEWNNNQMNSVSAVRLSFMCKSQGPRDGKEGDRYWTSVRRALQLKDAEGTQEDASKQGRKIADLDADVEVTLVDEDQRRNDDNLMFDTGVLDEQEVKVKKVVSTAEVTTASATTTTVDELTLAQTLIEIKAAKPKVVTTAATTTTTAVTRPKARGVIVQEPSEFRTTTSSSQTSQLLQAKDKGKDNMVKPEKPLKKKDQILIDEEIAQ